MDKIMSEDELVGLICNNLIAWAKEEAEANDDSFAKRYEKTKQTFLDTLLGRI